jgi:hypothetical protein
MDKLLVINLPHAHPSWDVGVGCPDAMKKVKIVDSVPLD